MLINQSYPTKAQLFCSFWGKNWELFPTLPHPTDFVKDVHLEISDEHSTAYSCSRPRLCQSHPC